MNSNFCKCSGILDFQKIDGTTIINNVTCLDFHSICLKCGQTVIHSRYFTPLGYVTAKVKNLGVIKA